MKSPLIVALLALVAMQILPLQAICACTVVEGSDSCCSMMAEEAAPQTGESWCRTETDRVEGPEFEKPACVVDVVHHEAPAVLESSTSQETPALPLVNSPGNDHEGIEFASRRIVEESPPPPTAPTYLLHATFLL